MDQLTKLHYGQNTASNQLTFLSISQMSQYEIIYRPLIDEFKRQLLASKQGELRIQLKKLDILALKSLFSLFRFLRNQKKLGATVKVYWHVEIDNTYMLETAMDFAQLYQIEVVIPLAQSNRWVRLPSSSTTDER